MRKPIPIDEWLTDNEDQLKWTQLYLSNINYKPSLVLDGLNRGQTLAELQQYLKQDTRIAPERLRKLKSAWNQYTCKKDNKKRSYTFTMSVNIEKRLKLIALRKPVNQAVESLIFNVGEYKKTLHKEYQSKEKERAKEWDDKIQKFESKKRGNLIPPNLRQARAALKEQQKLIDKLMQELCRNLVILEDNKLNDLDLTPGQLDKSIKKFKAIKKLQSTPEEHVTALIKEIYQSQSTINLVMDRLPDEYPPEDEAISPEDHES